MSNDMQIDNRLYDPAQHDKFHALCVKQPYADRLVRIVRQDEFGDYHAMKEIEVRSRNTKYRGDILICASASPAVPGLPSGATVGLVELYDVKPVAEFTEADWAATCIPAGERPATGYGWLMRNPRPVVEMPVKGRLGIYDLIVPKGDITQYPRDMEIGPEGWEIIKSKIK